MRIAMTSFCISARTRKKGLPICGPQGGSDIMVGRSRHAHTERNSKTYIRACTYTQADNQTFQSRSGFAHATDPPEVPGLCAEFFFSRPRDYLGECSRSASKKMQPR